MSFLKTKPKGALASAHQILESRGKLLSVIQKEEAGLSELIKQRVAADRALIVAETAEVLGDPADVPAAQKQVDAVMAAISKQGARLAGLRGALAKQAPELAAARDAIAQALGEHTDAIKSDFEKEWAAGVAAFSALQGRRQSLETRVGKLSLAAPSSTAVTLPVDVEAPFVAKEQIEGAISELAGLDRWSTYTPATNARPFTPAGVYQVISEHAGLGAIGTLVMEASAAPGYVRHLVNIGYLAALTDSEWSESVNAAQQAELKIQAERRAAEARARHAKDGFTPLVAQYPETRAAKNIPLSDVPDAYPRPIPAQGPSTPAAPRRLSPGDLQ